MLQQLYADLIGHTQIEKTNSVFCGGGHLACDVMRRQLSVLSVLGAVWITRTARSNTINPSFITSCIIKCWDDSPRYCNHRLITTNFYKKKTRNNISHTADNRLSLSNLYQIDMKNYD